MNTKINHVVRSTLSLTTAAPTQAEVLPYGASGVELRGTGAPTWQFTPRLYGAFWDDNGTWKDQTTNFNQRGDGSFWEADSFAASDDAFYLGFAVPVRGLYVRIINVNGTNSVLTVNYRKNDDSWATLSATDNTKAAGAATLAQSDTITWTVPSDWKSHRLANTVGQELFWLQWTVNVTLDSDVRIGAIVPLGVQANQPVAFAATTTILPRYWFDPENVGGMEATGDNTDTLVLDWLVTGKNTNILAE